ncbi:MAG: Hemolysin-type calcium-binding region [Conexibacter sp.]|nr:Hemolysin-type calcium-binding region [Conexibacter sp.]
MPCRAALLIVLAGCALPALVPAAAGATTHLSIGTAAVNGKPVPDALIYWADDTETIHIDLAQTASELVVASASAVDVPAGCTQDAPTTVRCPLGAVKSFVLVQNTWPTRPLYLVADPGVTVNLFARGGGGFADTLRGGAGDDRLEGTDPFATGPQAADTIDGRAGDDIITADGASTLDGGPGNDIVTTRDGAVLATLHGGEGDDRLSDAAVADGGPGDDEIIRALTADGGDGNDTIYGARNGTGGAGDDFLSSSAVAGPSTLDGGVGDDRISSGGAGSLAHGGPGNDRLYEGPGVGDNLTAVLYGDDGDDHLEGRYGGATLDGGVGDDELVNIYTASPNDALTWPGNTYLGGPGADTVRVKDGVADRVDCGADADAVAHDAMDTIVNCETDLDPAPPPPVYKDPIPAPARSALALRGASSLRVTATGTVRIALACAAKATCAGHLRLTAGRSRLADTKCKVKGTKTVALKLTGAATKLLRRRGKLKATLTFVPTAKGTVAPKARAVTLLAPRRRG